MGAAAIVFGVSLVIILVLITAVTLAWRNRVRRRRDETPGDRYRRAAQDIRRSGDGGHSGDPKIWPSSGGYDAGGGGA